MSETKNKLSKQQNHHGHQDQPPKKGQNASDPKNRQEEHSQKIGVDDIKERQQRQGIGTLRDKEEKQTTR